MRSVRPVARVRDAGLRRPGAWARFACAGLLRRVPRRQGVDRGSVTAEIAIALPALVLVSLAAIWGVTLAAAQVACVDAARAGARAAARGESLPAVRAAVSSAVPGRARVSVQRDAGLTRVAVRVTPGPAFASLFPRLVVEERAVALTEPGGHP